MPKRVDHAARRAAIAEALLRVVGRDGLAGVSLRQVAAEAGATAGLVQHYFPTKEAMVRHAMQTARDRYEARMTARLDGLGPDPAAERRIGALLGALLPETDEERADAAVALAFHAHAAVTPPFAADAAADAAALRDHLAALLAEQGVQDAPIAAAALLGTAEGLALHIVSAHLPVATARQGLARQIALVLAQ